MEANSLRNILVLDDGMWRCGLPARYAVASELSTLEVCTLYTQDLHIEPPQPNQVEVDLCVFIMSDFDRIREQVIRMFVEHCRTADPEPVRHLRKPTVCVGRQALEEDGPDCWSFVLQRDDWEDGIFNIGFEKGKALFIWSGD